MHFLQQEHKTKAVFVLHFTEMLDERIMGTELRTKLSLFKMETIAVVPSTFSSSRTKAGAGGGGGAGAALNDLLLDPLTGLGPDYTPLFRLTLGVATSSEGIGCAKAAGVPHTNVLTRAAAIRDSMKNNQPLEPLSISFSARELSLLKTFLGADWGGGGGDGGEGGGGAKAAEARRTVLGLIASATGTVAPHSHASAT
jgi:hypothetical protein